MYCPKCRTVNAAGNIFCTQCGAGLYLDVTIRRDRKGRFKVLFYFGPCETKVGGKKYRNASYEIEMQYEADPDPMLSLQWFSKKFTEELQKAQ